MSYFLVILLGFISFEHLTFIYKLVLVTVNMYLEKQMIATVCLTLGTKPQSSPRVQVHRFLICVRYGFKWTSLSCVVVL